MAPSRLTRFIALTCVATTLTGCASASPSDAGSANGDAQKNGGVTADGRWHPPTTTTTKVPSTTVAPTTVAPTTTAPPTTTSTTTTTTTTAPPADLCSLTSLRAVTNPPRFSAASTFNRPAACFATRPDSDKWATNWFRYANYLGRTDPTKRGRISVSFDAYSTPVYSAADATTTIRVFTTGWGYGTNLGSDNRIPWNPSWEPAPGNDLEMMIVDPTTGREWSLWGVQKINWTGCFTLDNLLSGWQAGVDLCVAQAMIGKNPDGSLSDATRSTGFSQDAGRGMGAVLGMALLPTLDEIEHGSINHALNMETYGTMFGPACSAGQMGTAAAGVDCGFAVAPATRLEWWNGPATDCGAVAQQNTSADRAKTVPEGMRFALNITDAQIESWLDSRGYTGAKRNTARIFAVAYRDYGWIISDTTCWDSSTAVEGVANPKARLRWAALGIVNPTSDGATLLDGLITSESQVRAIASPSSALITNSR
ncbi:MAG: hypothetical protein U0Q22_16370 [Acidimicrobiales bacterium]